MLVVAVPLNIITTLVTASTSDDAFNLDTGDDQRNDVSTGTEIAGILVTTTLSLVLMTLAAAACFRAVSSVYLGEQPDGRRARCASRRAGCCP